MVESVAEEVEWRIKDQQVHGVRLQDVADSAPFTNEWALFVKLRKAGPFAAHHASFENSLLKAIWPAPPFCPDFLSEGRGVATWGPWIDTCRP